MANVSELHIRLSAYQIDFQRNTTAKKNSLDRSSNWSPLKNLLRCVFTTLRLCVRTHATWRVRHTLPSVEKLFAAHTTKLCPARAFSAAPSARRRLLGEYSGRGAMMIPRRRQPVLNMVYGLLLVEYWWPHNAAGKCLRAHLNDTAMHRTKKKVCAFMGS